MKIKWYLLTAGTLQEQPDPTTWPMADLRQMGESWFDIQEAVPDELQSFLTPLNLHPLLLDRALAPANAPGVVSHDRAALLEFPAALDRAARDRAYLTLVVQGPVLVTIRPGPMPALDDLVHHLVAEKAPDLRHLPQILYEILDCLADLHAGAEIEARDQIRRLAKMLTENPGAVSASELANLSGRIEGLVSLLEDQLYCITGLTASDAEALKEPHRRAYLQDLQSEAEIAQRGIYRLESRMKDLYDYYQMAGSDRVEKRLRILTIISAISLPLALVTGIFGMNVGGLPATTFRHGFAVVMGVMAVIAAAELWYFIRHRWFD